MNHGPRETEEFFAQIQAESGKMNATTRSAIQAGKVALCVFPPALSLDASLSASKSCGLPFHVGSQNTHWEKSGAFTGEVSGPMLIEIGVRWSLTGHSERRQYFGETDETVRKRTESLLDQGFRVIACVGETRAQREAGETRAVLEKQITGILPKAGEGSARFLDGTLVIAYEPVWAIGTGLTATPEQAEEAHQEIRKQLWERFGMEAAGRTPILYGGSVTPENASALLGCANVDGALVGGASLKAKNFLALVEAAGRLNP